MSEEYSGQFIDDIISYSMIITGAFFSFLTVVMILANLRQMLTKVWGRLLLVIQIQHLVCCVISIPYYSPETELCQVGAAFYYFFFLVRRILFTDGQSEYVSHDAYSLFEAAVQVERLL